jgi:hypothetical protein
MTKRFAMLLPILLAVAAVRAAAGGEINDLLTALPVLPKPQAQAIPAPDDLKEFAKGVLILKGGMGVVLTGAVIIDQGPADGLEVFACMQNGKTHESVVRLSAENGQLVKAAFLTFIGLPDGRPLSDGVGSPEDSGLPARGTPLSMTMRWSDPDKPGSWLSTDASCLVRDRVNDKSYPPLPFIYTGSRFMTVEETGPGGQTRKIDRFMLDSTKSVVDIYDEGDALLASPFPGSGYDKHFEVNSGLCPPVGTPIQLAFQRCELPLTLVESPAGDLRRVGQDGGSPPLTDEALGGLLAAAYGAAATPGVRALGVVVGGSTERAKDVATRLRLLRLAVQVKAWVAPVFIPSAAH